VLANQQVFNDPGGVPSSVENRQATILYSSEGTQGSRKVVVDLQKATVEYKDQDNLPIVVEEIENVKEEIKGFLKRLTCDGLLPIQTYIDLDSSWPSEPCPLCGMLTASCISCYAFMCLNTDCPASRLVPFRSCYSHDRVRASCLPCLQDAQYVPLLGECPDCNLWLCREELVWCPGRTKDDSYWYVPTAAMFEVGLEMNASTKGAGREENLEIRPESANRAPLWAAPHACARSIGSATSAA